MTPPDDDELLSLYRPDTLIGNVVLITGGGTGIGLAIARMLGRLGARVILAARREDILSDAVLRLQEENIDAVWHPLNIRDDSSVSALFDWMKSEALSPSILVNNAGGQFPAKAEEISSNGFRAVMDLNVQGNWHMSHAFASRCFEDGRSGRIINIVFAHTGANPLFAHAQAARAAIVNLTQTLAVEWGKRGILVNAVGPGAIATQGLENYMAEKAIADGTGRLPVARRGTAMEIAAAVAFLCSPAGGYITGIHLPVDGGDALMGPDPGKDY